MSKRFLSIWFRHLATDWHTIRQPHLRNLPFVLKAPSHGRIIITATNAVAEMKGISVGMVLADARAIMPNLAIMDDREDLAEKLLKRLAEWCIRFSPIVAVDLPSGLLLDATGCSHLWGGDKPYVDDIVNKLNHRGYDVRVSLADTIGTAWGVARFGKPPLVIEHNNQFNALLNLPPEALRAEVETVERLHKLGLHWIKQFINIPTHSLRRRFGTHFISRLNMALGYEMETIEPILTPEPYQERLPCLEPIITATGIEIALKHLLDILCLRLQKDQKGLRQASFKGYRVDGKVEQIDISTNSPSHHQIHLFKLFEIKLPSIEPALGIELFILEAPRVEEYLPQQEKVWGKRDGLENEKLSELIDRIANRVGSQAVNRYLPDEHYWPERSIRPALSIKEKPATNWRADKVRPIQLLSQPASIEVTAPIPDYPPMLFQYMGKVHRIVKADGPERIEQEWWIQEGQHRDYYQVEDEEGCRYWLFRLGHYHDQSYQWFLHGFFA